MAQQHFLLACCFAFLACARRQSTAGTDCCYQILQSGIRNLWLMAALMQHPRIRGCSIVAATYFHCMYMSRGQSARKGHGKACS